MNSGAWTPQPDLDLETFIEQGNDGTATVFLILNGLVISHLEVITVPEKDLSQTGYAFEIDAYAYTVGTFDEEIRPTSIRVHPYAQPTTTQKELNS